MAIVPSYNEEFLLGLSAKLEKYGKFSCIKHWIEINKDNWTEAGMTTFLYGRLDELEENIINAVKGKPDSKEPDTTARLGPSEPITFEESTQCIIRDLEFHEARVRCLMSEPRINRFVFERYSTHDMIKDELIMAARHIEDARMRLRNTISLLKVEVMEP